MNRPQKKLGDFDLWTKASLGKTDLPVITIDAIKEPEYDKNIMKSYIAEQKNKILSIGLNPEKLISSVEETLYAQKALKNFYTYIVNLQNKNMTEI